jgi:uncharacterized membrane protein
VGGFSLYNLLFIGGLLLSVRVMVAGVERGVADGQLIVRTRWVILAGGATLAGFIGSVLVRLDVAVVTMLVAVLGGAVAGAWSAQWLVRRAAAMPLSDHEFDPRFELQGVPATVVVPIPADGEGLVQLPAGLSLREDAIPARSLDGAPIASGMEVGVERIEDGVAFVEAWSAIEARL